MDYSRSREVGWARGLRYVVILLLAVLPVAQGQSSFRDKTINTVEIRYRGAKTVDKSRLRNFMSVAPGQKFSNEVLDADIKSLYESGLVDDVRFLAEEQGAGLRLICEVVTRPSLAGVGFVGNNKFSDDKLAGVTKLKAGRPLSDADILEARRNIEDHYRDSGYPDILIQHKMQATSREGWADLVFIINEGNRNEVRNIRFEGNQAFSDVELRREMETKEKGFFSFFTKSGQIDYVELERDKERILDFYRNEGYMRAAITEMRREELGDGRADLIFSVYEGPKYTVGSIQFGKMTVFTPEELDPALTMVAGDVFSAKKLRDDIRMIRSYYGSRGYADAEVNPDTRTVEEEGVVHLIYRITEGRRYRVGKVNIEGNSVTKDKVIRREVPLKPGDWFNSVDIDVTERRLNNLNLFGAVQAQGIPSSEAGYRDVDVLVQEKKTGEFSMGASFGLEQGVVGRVSLDQRNFDISNPWGFRGAGQYFGMLAELGNRRRSFKLTLVEPWFMGYKLRLGGEVYYRDLLFLSDQYEQTEVGGALFLRKPVGRNSYVKAEYRLEQIEVDLDGTAASPSLFSDFPGGPGVGPGFGGDFVRSAVELEYVYDSRDSNQLPRKGGRGRVGATIAGGPLGGDVDIYEINTSGSYHWTLPYDVILNINGSATVVDGLSGSDGVPIFDRLFLGGQKNLRGFDLRDVGPRDPVTGDVFGGQTAAFGSLEVTFPIVESVRGAAFVDAGFVALDPWDFAFSQLHADAGLGLRLNLPFGPFAIDYAIPLQNKGDPAADRGGQFNIYLNYQY